MTRSGHPDAIDSIVPMVYGNLAIDLIMDGKSGRMVCMKDGRYDNVPFEVVTEYEKKIDVERFYDTERYRPVPTFLPGNSRFWCLLIVP